MTDSLERDRAALNRAMSALTDLQVNLQLISDYLSKVKSHSETYDLHFDSEHRFVGESSKHKPRECRLANHDFCASISSNCEWLQKHLDELLKTYLEADNALWALPSRLTDKLDALTGVPWFASVRCHCLDNIMKWPGEKSHQTSYASEKVLGSVGELLEKAERYSPFSAWADFIRLLQKYGHELYAIRQYVVPRPGAADDPEAPPIIDDLVTLDQVAPLTGLSKRTLERYRSDNKLPDPDVPGGGGKANKWFWTTLRQPMSKFAGRPLPERFPGSRII